MTSRFNAFRHRDFRLLWGSNVVSRIGTEMQKVAVYWQVYLLTKSALALGLIGACRVLPTIVFALTGGAVADAFDRRRVLLATQTMLALTSAAMALLTWRGWMTLPILYALVAVNAATNAFDGPARSTLVTNLLPDEDLANGLTIQVNAIQTAMALGPVAAAFVLPRTSIEVVYAIDAASFAFVLAALFVLRAKYAKPAKEKPEVSVAAIRDAFAFLAANSALIWLMVGDFLGTFFGGAKSMLPIYADEVFHRGAQGLGWLVAAPAVGSTLASLVMSARPPVRRTGVTILASIAIYGLCVAVFGMLTNLWLALLVFALSGAADAVSTVVRQVVRQTLTPDSIRGRMTGVNMIFALGGPQLGEVEAGVVAKLTSPILSVVSGGVACLLIAAGLPFVSPTLRRLRTD